MASNNFNTSKSNSAGITANSGTDDKAVKTPPKQPGAGNGTVGGKLGTMAGNLPAGGEDTTKK